MTQPAQNIQTISPAQLQEQEGYTLAVQALLASRYTQRPPQAFVHTFGCQGNVADSERLKGMLQAMGYALCDTAQNADLVLYNTCAIRAHAEDRALGNIGALKPIKQQRRGMKIVLCGCMVQQEQVAQLIREKYPFVDIVFGTHVLHRLPEFLYQNLTGGKRVLCVPDSDGVIAEGLPLSRDNANKAWLPIMYGCNNFCSYCIVPYVRGRERSREPQQILKEARELIAAGYKEITLLGQNVNSYGAGLKQGVDFAWLLKEINAIPGDFWIRFMTSHPKDCTPQLLDTMAACEKVAKHLHLPVQSGNNAVLARMNRRYTREGYLELIRYAKSVMPQLSLTSDIIVGFPGETRAQFLDTLSLVEQVAYTSLFTFVFSPREGTQAATFADPVPREEKVRHLQELCERQEQIAAGRTAQMRGKTYRVLCEEPGRQGEGLVAGRTEGNVVIEFPAPQSVIGTFQTVRVKQSGTWVLSGELV